ncbi:MAG: hypothetical protein Q8P89_03250 [bacterium]|nr:hypothetical protein [bacterium]
MANNSARSKFFSFDTPRFPTFRDAISRYRMFALLFSLMAYGVIVLALTSVISVNQISQNFTSQAAPEPIVFKDLSGNLLPVGSSSIPYTASATVRIELTAPYPAQG